MAWINNYYTHLKQSKESVKGVVCKDEVIIQLLHSEKYTYISMLHTSTSKTHSKLWCCLRYQRSSNSDSLPGRSRALPLISDSFLRGVVNIHGVRVTVRTKIIFTA